MMRRRIRLAKGALYLLVCVVLTGYGIVVVFHGIHQLFLEEGLALLFHSFGYVGIWLWLRWGQEESPLRFLKCGFEREGEREAGFRRD
ncbi:MAG: hypothetical protein R3199_11325 [Gemmatimonadota bacterium]|nr:hypothetical protein [Gemmatimonadota bacterium]